VVYVNFDNTFYFPGGEATELPSMPEIFVKNFGQLSLPLTKSNADNLIKLCRQAPYGHGYETLVDTSIRDTFEIAPSQISFKNPDWQKKLKLLKNMFATLVIQLPSIHEDINQSTN